MCSYTLALGNLSEILSAITYIYFSSFVLQIGYTVLFSQENIQDFMNPGFFFSTAFSPKHYSFIHNRKVKSETVFKLGIISCTRYSIVYVILDFFSTCNFRELAFPLSPALYTVQ